MAILDYLFEDPNHKYISFQFHGDLDFNNQAPIISGAFSEKMPSCIACASLDSAGFAGLAHIGPYENGIEYAREMFEQYVNRGQRPGDVSFIVAGTNRDHIDQVTGYLQRKEGLKVTPVHLDPNPSGVIDMGIDPKDRKLVISRSFNRESRIVDF